MKRLTLAALVLSLAGCVTTIPIPDVTQPSFDSFVIVGRPAGDVQFSDADYEGLAEYDIVVIEKWHGGWNVSTHQEAAREIDSRNPDATVLPYLNARYRFLNDEWGTDTFRDEWLLRNVDGEPVPFVPVQNRESGEPSGYYYDLSNPELREWLVNVSLEWNEQAPYDGVFLDNAVKIAYDYNRQYWNNHIGSEKVDAWNEGLLLLLEEANERLDGLVINNGFRRQERTDDRNLEQLAYSDGALNEVFCMSGGLRLGELPTFWNETLLIDDLELQDEIASSGIALQKTNYVNDELSDAQIDDISRFCMGLFALAHVPGHTYYKYGTSYNARFGEIEQNAQGIDVRYGDPLGPRYEESGVQIREYESGYVFVNPGNESRTFTSPDDVTETYGPSPGANHGMGTSVTLGAHEAVFAEKR